MIQIDIEMPEKCGLCPLFHAEHPMHCQGVKADRKKKIVAPYGQPRPDWCPLHEATADPDTVSRQQIHCKDCKHCYPPLTAVVDNEVKEVSDFRCSRMFGFTEADGWCYMFERKSSDG